ncbi:MAG: S24/S26 family peptidase [Pseudomonadota bacterium]
MLKLLKRCGVRVVRIQGDSMAPALLSGDVGVFIQYRSRFLRPKRGHVALIDHPRLGMIVKRVTGFRENNEVDVRGDASTSTPAIDLGPLPANRVWGRLLLRLNGQPKHSGSPAT